MADIMVTQEGYDKLVAELEYLRKEKRAEVSIRLRNAIDDGDDLLENAEYEAAKNEQSFTEGRIKDLEFLVGCARIVEGSGNGSVEIGSVVKLREEGEDTIETYYIVGAPEANSLEHKISNESPIGKAVIGHFKGEVVSVSAPMGSFTMEIVDIE